MTQRAPLTTRLLSRVLVLLLVCAAATIVGRTATAAGTCRYPSGVPMNRWSPLPQPPGVRLVSAGQLDDDPCTLVGADADHGLWRSDDGGRVWRHLDGQPPVSGIFTEGLTVQSNRGGGPAPVLAVGPDTSVPGSPLPRLLVSHNGGMTFAPAMLSLEASVDQSPVDETVAEPLPVSVETGALAAATATHYVKGAPTPYLYVVAHPEHALPAAQAAGAPGMLVKSDDGGATFHPLPGAADLTPTVVAVNPTSADEIWVNDITPGAAGGGAWVSVDGGQSFSQACCANATVSDITITPAPGGGVVILLATNQGVMSSVDDGSSWTTISSTSASAIRTAPDAASAIVVQTPTGTALSTAATTQFAGLPGLPSGCAPRGLRRDALVPATFLVDCGGSAGIYRLVLDGYQATANNGSASTSLLPSLPGLPANPVGPPGRPLSELATWLLPDANTASGAVAFSGTALYYDQQIPGDVGVIQADTGRYLGVIHTDLNILSLSFDLKRNRLIITTRPGELVAYGLGRKRLVSLGAAPTGVPSYDSFIDGLSWVPEDGSLLYRDTMTGGPAASQRVCTVIVPDGDRVSTYVAAGDGGGYIQGESDTTLFRIDRHCNLVGTYSHRRYSESTAENDAMACDTQTFFPQTAVWIRDSLPGTVTGYGVPVGYCPMPARLLLSTAGTVHQGTTSALCARLVNATTGAPAANRPITVTAAGLVVGNGQTDLLGRLCLPYLAPLTANGKTVVPVQASFPGDSALYPATTRAALTVVGTHAAVIHPPRPAALLAPPPPPPAVPANPIANPLTAGAPGPAPAPNPAVQGQAQPQSQAIAQGVVVPQRQQQLQLALARAQNQLDAADGNAMVRVRRRPAVPVNAPVLGTLAMLSCAASLGLARRVAPVLARRSPPPRTRGRP